MGNDFTSPSAKDELFNASMLELEQDVLELEKINIKDDITIMEEIKLMLMCSRIKDNLKLANELRLSLISTYNEHRAVYYRVCNLISRTNNAVVRFTQHH